MTRSTGTSDRERSFETLDVFAGFDSVAGHETDVDPYPVLEELLRQGPVYAGDLHAVLGVDKSISLTATSGGYRGLPAPVFSALSYEAVAAVLQDSNAFSQEAQLRAYVDSLGYVLTALEGAEHRRARRLIKQAFTNRSMDVWMGTVIEPALRRVGARLNGKDQSDLIRDFIFHYPAEVIAGILGLPEHDTRRYMHLATASVSLHDPELAAWGFKRMNEWIAEIIEERRATRDDGADVISLLLHADLDGEHLTLDEIATFVRFLYPAGFETTYRSLSNAVLGLLREGQWGLIRDDRSLVPTAVDEALRWETSLLGHPRVARHDMNLFGAEVPKGAVVLAFHAAANRDPARWKDPAVFDARRPSIMNATFGFGPHLCIGKALAQAEMRAALNFLLDTYPNLHLDPAADPDEIRIRGIAFRSPHRLPVVLH